MPQLDVAIYCTLSQNCNIQHAIHKRGVVTRSPKSALVNPGPHKPEFSIQISTVMEQNPTLHPSLPSRNFESIPVDSGAPEYRSTRMCISYLDIGCLRGINRAMYPKGVVGARLTRG